MTILRALHILGGAVALVALLVVTVRRKGGAGHRTSGWFFAGGMIAVLASGAALALRRLFDARPENDAGAYFLLYVGWLTAAGLVAGLRAVATRRRDEPSRDPLALGVPAILVVASVALASFGAATRTPLFLAFAPVGLIRGLGDLRYWLRAPADKHAWLYRHISGMGTAAIGAVTAFAVVNAQRFAPSLPMLLVWTLPGVMGGVVLTLVQRRYRGVSVARA